MPAVGPVTVLVVDVVPVTTGAFVVADRVVEVVVVGNVEVVEVALVELVDAETLVNVAKVVVVVETTNTALRTSFWSLVMVIWYGPEATVPTTKLPVNIPVPAETVQVC